MLKFSKSLILMPFLVAFTSCDKQTTTQSKGDISKIEKSITIVDNRHLKNGVNALGEKEPGRSLIIADAQSSFTTHTSGGIDIPFSLLTETDYDRVNVTIWAVSLSKRLLTPLKIPAIASIDVPSGILKIRFDGSEIPGMLRNLEKKYFDVMGYQCMISFGNSHNSAWHFLFVDTLVHDFKVNG